MTHADHVIRKVSDLRDLCHRLKAAPKRALTDEERAWRANESSPQPEAKTAAVRPNDSR